MNAGPPSHWLRQRAGDPGTVRLNAAEAASIAQRPGAVGDHTTPAGLVWREPNPDVRGGFDHFTITPVWEKSPKPPSSGAAPHDLPLQNGAGTTTPKEGPE